jgi:chemotaxis methyl-accepting protein methylase
MRFRCSAPIRSFRIWQAGCSLGEEAFSLAILLEEEGLYDRALDLRDRHQRSDAAPGPRRHLSAELMQKYTQNYVQRRRPALVLGVLHGALRLRDPAGRRCSATSSSRSTTW